MFMTEPLRPIYQFSAALGSRLFLPVALSLLLFPACDSLDGNGRNERTSPRDSAQPLELVEPADGAETANALRFSWAGSAPSDGFQLQVAMDSLFTEIVTDANVGTLNGYIVRELRRNRTYFWRVRGVQESGANTWSSPRTFTPVRMALLPDRPDLRAPADLAGPLPIEITVEWEPVPNAISYHLQVFMDEDLLLYQTDLDKLTGTRFQMTDLVYTYPYWWRVRAESVAGYGAWSPVWKFQIEDGE